MSPPTKPLECPTTFLNYYHFAGAPRPDSKGRAACPVCSKPVQLMARGRVPLKSYIPRHNRAQPTSEAVAAATTSALVP